MKSVYSPDRLDVRALARAGERLAGVTPLSQCERLLSEMAKNGVDLPSIHWQVQGEWREQLGGAGQCWLHVSARLELPLVCQRCLSGVVEVLSVERSFRFVADEVTAEREDEDAEEDVLVLSPQFNLIALLEDELLMALPLVPRHEPDCPTSVTLTSQDADFEAASAERPHPFAALSQLKRKH
jgi:uncharacterized protein